MFSIFGVTIRIAGKANGGSQLALEFIFACEAITIGLLRLVNNNYYLRFVYNNTWSSSLLISSVKLFHQPFRPKKSTSRLRNPI